MKKTLLSIILGLGLLSNAGAQTSILSENFEGGALPAGWSITTLATDGGWKFGNATLLSSTDFPFTAHTIFAGTNDDKCNCTKSNDLLKTPMLDFTTNTNVFMSFASFFVKGTYQAKTEVAKVVVSTNNGVTWTDVASFPGYFPWTINDVNLSAYAGMDSVMVGFKYNDGGGWLYGWGVDDVEIYEPQTGTDLSVSSTVVGKLDPRPSFVGYPKYLTSLPLNVQTTVKNQLTVPVTSFDFSWTDGIASYNQTITGIQIDPLATYTFNSTTQYSTLAGLNTITSTISNVNGAVDLNPSNDAASFEVTGLTAVPDKKYFIEEATGTWCQWCPRGAVFMDYMEKTYPTQFVGVAVHNADPMVVTAYDAGIGGLVAGYPSAIPNRNAEIDPSDMEGDFIDYISTPTDVNISGSATLNLATNQITIDLSSTFSQNLTGDYRFMAVLVEDSVKGSGSTYNQVNAYGNNAAGPMGGFESLPASVPAATMKYDFVNRALLGTFTGQTASIPASVISGTAYNYQFANIPYVATWKKDKLTGAAVVIDGSTGLVMNATKFPINVVTGLSTNNVGSLKGSFIFPTLTSENITLSVTLSKTAAVTYTITDVLGKVVRSTNLGTIQSGTSTTDFNVNNLTSGVYFMNLVSTEGKMTQKFIKQ